MFVRNDKHGYDHLDYCKATTERVKLVTEKIKGRINRTKHTSL